MIYIYSSIHSYKQRCMYIGYALHAHRYRGVVSDGLWSMHANNTVRYLPIQCHVQHMHL